MFFNKIFKLNLIFLIFIFHGLIYAMENSQPNIKLDCNSSFSKILTNINIPKDIQSLIYQFLYYKNWTVSPMFSHRSRVCSFFISDKCLVSYSNTSSILKYSEIVDESKLVVKNSLDDLENYKRTDFNTCFSKYQSTTDNKFEAYIYKNINARISNGHKLELESALNESKFVLFAINFIPICASISFSKNNEFFAFAYNTKQNFETGKNCEFKLFSLSNQKADICKIKDLPQVKIIYAILFINNTSFMISSENGLFICDLIQNYTSGWFRKKIKDDYNIKSKLLDTNTNRNIVLSANGKYLAYNRVTEDRNSIKILDLTNNKIVREINTDIVTELAISKDANYLAIGNKLQLTIFDLNLIQKALQLNFRFEVSALLFTPKDSLLTGLDDGRVFLLQKNQN